MNIVRDKALDIIITLLSLAFSTIISPFIQFGNEIFSQLIVLVIFLAFYILFKFSKKFINPFSLDINPKNLKDTLKPNETHILVDEEGNMSTSEKYRTIEIQITIKFQNTISRYLIGRIVAKNNLYLNLYTDTKSIKLSSDKISDFINQDDPRSILIDIGYTTEKLAQSNLSELESKKEAIVIVEYIGLDHPEPEKTNIHACFFVNEWSSRADKVIFTMFKGFKFSNNHEIFVKSE